MKVSTAWILWMAILCFSADDKCLAFVTKFPASLVNTKTCRNKHPKDEPTVLSSSSAAAAMSATADNNFEFMKSLDDRLEQLERRSPEILEGFYEPHLQSFCVRPGSKRFSVTSTLFALDSIISSQDPELYSSIIDMNIGSNSRSCTRKISLRSVLEASLMAEWNEDDLFQVPLIVHTLLQVDKDRKLFNPKSMKQNKEYADRFRTLISSLLSARPLRRNGPTQPLSDYLIFRCAQAMVTLNDATPDVRASSSSSSTASGGDTLFIGGLPAEAIPEDAASQLSFALSRYAEVSFNELCRQLAYRTSSDRTNFDPIRLAYAVLTYIITSNSLSNTAGIELIPGEGPSSGVAVGPPNEKLVKEALRVFFEEQNEDGLWDKGQPIYKSFRKTGRNVGNAFVYGPDTLGSLLSALPAEYFRPHIQALQKTLSWMESNQVVEIIPDYCDPETLKCTGKSLRGWCSPHLRPETLPTGWSTAQTLSCLSKMRKVVRELLHEDVLVEFGGGPSRRRLRDNNNKGGGRVSLGSSSESSYESWERLLDTDVDNPSKKIDDCMTIKCVLMNRFVVPFSDELTSPSIGAAYSAILFGPPGTAKTTICEALAERMGWDFLVIDTAAFLKDGLSNVAARIRYVFQRLMELESCVILFDEIEEFCLDRETPGLGMESRMLTTAMLTAINDLRRKKRSIFFLATNRLKAFDSAIIRPGRFDMQLFVGTPNLNAKCILFEQQLNTVQVDENIKKQSIDLYREFLSEKWTEDAMFMNYLESRQFARACADIVGSTRGAGELTKDIMAEILKSQAAVMTVRGEARDEYVSSMDLTRL